jgi:hypothetical protein
MTRRAATRPHEKLPAAEAHDRDKAHGFSLALRRCCACRRIIGARLWPWSGKLVVETHGYCGSCAAQLVD